MLETSSFGRAAPKIKTINVEANLLSERIAEQEHIRELSVRRLIGLCAAVVIGCTILPYLLKLDGAASRVLYEAETKQADLAAAISQANERRQSVQPMLDQIALHEHVLAHARAILGESSVVINAASLQLAFSSFHAEAVSGKIKIGVISDAESYSAAREFVTEAGSGENVKSSTLVSMRRSDNLGSEGVRFEFKKEVGVNP